ncbi:MAG TPA: PEP-CTERM sorting domain-containing protein [Longimicrobiales bacterium]|nr:PEP-CTERM sorting domain-containing protein [Longimicrobiales bacterium]
MIRHATFIAVLLLCATMSSPWSAAAESGGGHPLRTWCSSPTMDYCIGIMAFTYAVSACDTDPCQESDSFTTATVEGFGSVLDSGGSFAVDQLYFLYETTLGFDTSPHMGLFFSSPHEITNASEGTNILGAPVRASTPDDFYLIEFIDGQTSQYSACWTSDRWRTLLGGGSGSVCHRVPEPATPLLLLTGLLGVGFVTRRRAALESSAEDAGAGI